MLRLSSRRRGILAETLRELANLCVGVLALGQFVGTRPWSFWLVLAGVAWWFVLVGLALLFAEGHDNG